MRILRFVLISCLVLGITILNSGCDQDNPLTDAQKLAALRHVKLHYNGMTYDISLPPGAGSGQSFAELMLADSSTYTNPANYSITIIVNATADNTDSAAEDAKFDGLGIDVVMDTLESEPIEMMSGAFEVDKGDSIPVTMDATINLETHRKTGLYIFQQTVDGNDLETTLYPYLLYNIGTLEGEIPLPAMHKNIPTEASAETKEFLGQLLASGIFDE